MTLQGEVEMEIQPVHAETRIVLTLTLRFKNQAFTRAAQDVNVRRIWTRDIYSFSVSLKLFQSTKPKKNPYLRAYQEVN